MPPKHAASKTSSSPLRALFILEAAMNILSAIPMMVAPSYVLSFMIVPLTAKNAASSIVHPASLGTSPVAPQLVQFLGAVLVALTVPLFYGIPDPAVPTNSKSATPSSSPKPSSPSALLALARVQGDYRRRTYVMLATGEVFLSLVIITHLITEKEISGRPGALKPGFLFGALVTLMNLAVLRAWAMIVREYWFGGLPAPVPASSKKDS